jgi:hypothetical protein
VPVHRRAHHINLLQHTYVYTITSSRAHTHDLVHAPVCASIASQRSSSAATTPSVTWRSPPVRADSVLTRHAVCDGVRVVSAHTRAVSVTARAHTHTAPVSPHCATLCTQTHSRRTCDDRQHSTCARAVLNTRCALQPSLTRTGCNTR